MSEIIEMWDVMDHHGNPTGRTCPREPMQPWEYHLVVNVWILRRDGHFLISRRTPNKPFPLMWECTGGSAISGDDSLTTAIKEAREEVGITLLPENGQLYTRYRRDFVRDGDGWKVIDGDGSSGGDFVDVWLFRQEVELSDVTLCPDETCDARLATAEEILQMQENGAFVEAAGASYLREFFVWCGE